jgi:DNA-binding NtrC family response regulator
MPPLRERGQDIILLFRLFAMQMAEKYRLPKITLTEEAKAQMLRYKWPGNVRQLKNITEQMSVLSEQREIDIETLRHFIPQDQESTQLAVIQRDGGNHSYENERELLYKVLYELQGNVSDLRKELNTVRKQMEEVRDLNGAIGFTGSIAAVNAENLPATKTARKESVNVEDAIAEEISEPETLNLSDLGRQLVEKALERNNGNRKRAAQELGISDRTLYRRLKQYGLE